MQRIVIGAVVRQLFFSTNTSKRLFFSFYYSLESCLSKVYCKLSLILLMHSEKFQSGLLILLICDCFILSVQSRKSDFIQRYISSEQCVLFRRPKLIYFIPLSIEFFSKTLLLLISINSRTCIEIGKSKSDLVKILFSHSGLFVFICLV